MKRRSTPRAAITARLVAGTNPRQRRPFRVTPDPYTGRVRVTAPAWQLPALHALLLPVYPVRLVNDGTGLRLLEVQL